jgi:hypothetical protein
MTVSAADTVSLALTFATAVPRSNLDLQFQVVDAGGAVSEAAVISTAVLDVGTGVVQVTAAWDSRADLDLHVVEPCGDEIYLDDPESISGGTLDLDSNASCVDGPRNENIYWPSSAWCGRAPQTFTGTIGGAPTGGGPGAGIDVGTFIF